jgi:hypothetical protein
VADLVISTEKVANMAGLITPEVGQVLAELAADVPADRAIVEIGSFQGQSTTALAFGAKAGGGAHVWAVDPWDLPGTVYGKHGYNRPIIRELFEEHLRSARVWSQVIPVRAFSNDAAADWVGPPIGLLFIDGDHTATGVRSDIAAWTQHLADDHVIALDDWGTKRNPGVAEVAAELEDRYSVTIEAERLAVCRPL